MTLRKICTIMVSVKRIDFFQGVSVAHYIQRKCRCHNASEEHDVRYVDKGRSDTVLRRLVVFFPYSIQVSHSKSGLYWGENVPPTDIADRISASFPFKFLMGLSQRRTREISEADK